MRVTPEIRTLALERRAAEEIAEVAVAARACAACATTAWRRSSQGRTSIAEVARVIGSN